MFFIVHFDNKQCAEVILYYIILYYIMGFLQVLWHVRSIGDSKFTVGMSVSVHDCQTLCATLLKDR